MTSWHAKGQRYFVTVVPKCYNSGTIPNHQQVLAKQNINMPNLNTIDSEVSPRNDVCLVCKHAAQEVTTFRSSPDGDHHGRCFLSMEKRFIAQMSGSTLESLVTRSQHNGTQPSHSTFRKGPYTQTRDASLELGFTTFTDVSAHNSADY
jgi:hypothetical protein